MKILSRNISYIGIFIGVLAIVFSYTFYTDHRWEDWYITYRASKNLGQGNGLVYNIGERVQTFTSPLGTLIPALFTFIKSENPDEFSIWGFRIVCALLLALTAVMIFRLFKKMGFDNLGAYMVVALFSFNILIVDFSINGMETAFMMFFLTLFTGLLLSPERHLVSKLALCMAGLMYSRPDSFIYFGSVAFGFFLFKPRISNVINGRKEFAILFLKAGLICLLLYLPWIIGTYLYYGTPIPHTVIAKGGNKHFYIKYLLKDFIFMVSPRSLLSAPTRDLFMPAYFYLGGWPKLFSYLSLLAVIPCVLYFLFFSGRKEARALSVGIYISIFYLYRVSGQGPMPWYLPNITLICIFCLNLILFTHIRNRNVRNVLMTFFLSVNVFIFLAGARLYRFQQQLIENENRKQIGLYLKKNSIEGQTVFLECLGYIGYYSELKTYDYPGMSSPEVVAHKKTLKSGTGEFCYYIRDLKPDWLVLRPKEIYRIEKILPGFLNARYVISKTFDVSDKIPNIMGDSFMKYDAVFTVYSRK